MIKLFIIGLFILLSSKLSYSQEDRWQYVASYDVGNNVTMICYIDKTSIKCSSQKGVNKCELFVKYVFIGDKRVDYIIDYTTINCYDRTIFNKGSVTYYLDNTISTDNYFKNEEPIFPDTFAEELIDLVCK